MRAMGRGVVLPQESFAELAFELRMLAREKAASAEHCELLVASIEAGGEIDRDRGLSHVPPRQRRPLALLGMRDAVRELELRARAAGKAADAMTKLAEREEEIRAMFAPLRQRGTLRWLRVVLKRRMRQAALAAAASVGGLNAA
jgi:hypothetical protein